MSYNLSTGAIEAMLLGTNVNKPVLQLMALKLMAANGLDRYRLMLSDGVHSNTSAMLATQLNDQVTNGTLAKNVVLRIEKYNSNTISQDRRVVIILEYTVLGKPDNTIGDPQPYKGGQSDDKANNNATKSGDESKPSNGPSSGYSGQQQQQQPSHGSSRPQPVTQQQQGGSFYGGQQAQARSTLASSSHNVPPSHDGSTPSKVVSIATLNPYQNRWTIRARVTNKSAVRSWSNSRGEGKLFSVTLADESGEIRATAFRDSVDKFNNYIELNKVYYVSKMQLKTANKQFSSLNNDYEMTFTNETQFVPCDDSDLKIPALSFNFVRLADLERHTPSSTIDCIGVVKSVSDLQKIMSKQTQKEIVKRDVFIVDQSLMQVRLTLWGADAESFDGSHNPILAVKGCRISDFGGRSLSTLMSSTMAVDPDVAEAHTLRGWFDSVGKAEQFSEYHGGAGVGPGSSGGAANWKMLGDLAAENLGGSDKADFFTAKATIVFSRKENALYMACPSPDCNKKVVDQGNGQYRCEKCQKEFPDFKWRLLLSINVADSTDSLWATCFQDTAETVLGTSATVIGELKSANDGKLDHLFQEAHFKSYIFKFRAKMENFNDETRLKVICTQATPVDFREYNRKLLTDINRMMGLA